MTISNLIILVCISIGGLVNAGLNGDITLECKDRPTFEISTVQALAAVGTAVNKPMEDGRQSTYNKAHVLPWTFIRTKVCGEFNNQVDESTKTDKELQAWQKAVKSFNNVLHTVDEEWLDYSRMTRKQQTDYKKANDDNKNDCDTLIDRVQLQRQGNRDIVSSVVAVAKCMNSAPGNLRPGFANTNGAIGQQLDPMLKQKVDDGKAVQESDLTAISKRLHEKFGLAYPTYGGGGIMSSDQTEQN